MVKESKIGVGELLFSCDIFDVFGRDDLSIVISFRKLENRSPVKCAHKDHKWHGWVEYALDNERYASEEYPIGYVFACDQCQVYGLAYTKAD